MPKTEVLLYQEEDGTVPLRDWLYQLEPKARTRCLACLIRLEDMGYDLRRPEADYLRDGIYELRTRHGRVNLRILYFFRGRQVVVVSHGLTKENVLPAEEIDLAVERKGRFEETPEMHTLRWER